MGEKGLTAYPKAASALFALGLAHYRAGEWDRAAARLQESLDADPGHAWLCWPALALAHHKLGHRDEARQWLERASDRNRQEAARLAEAPGGFSTEPDWPDFHILYAEAAAVLAGAKP